MITETHCARDIVQHSKYNAHTDPLFKQLYLLKVKYIFDSNTLKLFYKPNQNCLPVYVTDLFQYFSRKHDHNTRQSLVLNKVLSSSRYGENCIRFYLPLLVNNSSQCVLEKVTTRCYQGFISYIKKRMIDRYVAQCYVRLCYICNRKWWNASDVSLLVIVPVYTLVNMFFSNWVSLYVCVIFHLMCSIFCRHCNCFSNICDQYELLKLRHAIVGLL